MGRFDRRVAVITGAARGIGFGIAQRLASEGASVAILDLDESAAADAAGRLELAYHLLGGRVVVAQAQQPLEAPRVA